jgi:hypothetical protein
VSGRGRQRRHDTYPWSRVRHSARASAAPLHRCAWSGQPALQGIGVQRGNEVGHDGGTGGLPTNMRTFRLSVSHLPSAMCQYRREGVLRQRTVYGSLVMVRNHTGASIQYSIRPEQECFCGWGAFRSLWLSGLSAPAAEQGRSAASQTQPSRTTSGSGWRSRAGSARADRQPREAPA